MSVQSLLPLDTGFDLKALRIPVQLFVAKGVYTIRYQDKKGNVMEATGTAVELEPKLRAAGFKVKVVS